MTDWVVHGSSYPGLVPGDECELRDPAKPVPWCVVAARTLKPTRCASI